ncbi:MAG: RtcB family protein [Candidatus Heimdallarchaeota archaeon]|nr:RtcB family protein [Candidatus Heimdallarchaeota archaeon]
MNTVETSMVTSEQREKAPKIKLSGISPGFEKWIELAQERILSLAAGNRIGSIAPRISEVGFSKILFAANELGADIEQANPFLLFAPDGTCSYNPIRTQRGFSYGGIFDLAFDGMIATNNSMPNGCGFSIFSIDEPIDDKHLLEYLKQAQMSLGQDQLSELGKGNHFAGLYYVNDPQTGEDTGKRFVVIHCSGHVGGHLLYHPESWLSESDGYYQVTSPHGPITLLEGEAKEHYLQQFAETDIANSNNRSLTMQEIFADSGMAWRTIESITHQGLLNQGSQHIIGAQHHDSLQPIAFNPEEGLVVAKTRANLSKEFLETWNQGQKVFNLGLEHKLQKVNLTPHGGGYEFSHPVRNMEINLGPEGISGFNLELDVPNAIMSFAYFREIREWMTYRNKKSIMDVVHHAQLADVVYELPPLMQIYPLQTIPGGTH